MLPIVGLSYLGISNNAMPALVIVAILLVIAIIKIIMAPKKNKKSMDDEMQRSVQRLNDPSYALALKKAGYNVPDVYLHSVSDK